MSRSQLETVFRWENEKEEQAAKLFQQAQNFVFENEQKLTGLQQYRLDYVKKLHAVGSSGLNAKSLTQHQSFIGKLDTACEQQQALINNAKQAAQQRKEQWLVQQRKRKAVQLLIDKQKYAVMMKLEREEQSLNDEVALQRYFRKSN